MGRRPKPVTLHMRQGTYQPSRQGASPLADGALIKPRGLGRWGGKLWDRVIDFVYQAGGGECDTDSLVGMCQWYNQYRRVQGCLEKTSPRDEDYRPLQTSATTAWRNFVDMASRFGLTPADRTKLKYDVQETTDPLDNLIGKRA